MITKCHQPLHSSKNTKKGICRYCVAGSSSSKVLEALADSAKKTCLGRPRKRQPTEIEFDHELHLWLKSKKSRKTHLDIRVEGGAAQSGRKIAPKLGEVLTTKTEDGNIQDKFCPWCLFGVRRRERRLFESGV